MPFDASQASLPELFRSLNVAPEEKEALVRLAEQVARLEHEREHREMLFEASGPPRPPPPGGRKRGRAHLWVVKSAVLPVAGLAAFTRAHARHLLAATAGAALLTGGTLAPDVLQPVPAAQAPHHHAVAPHPRDRDTVVLPPAVPARLKRRRLDNDDAVKAPATARSAGPSPSADPAPTVVPDPSPSPAPPPFPSPTPTCTPLHGHHCHPGAGDAVRVLGALAGPSPGTMAAHATGGIMGS